MISGRPQDVLHQLAVYARQKDPANFAERLLAYRPLFAKPPTLEMVQQAIKTSGGQRGGYKCKSGPCAQMCAYTLCATRRYGISGGEHSGFQFGVLTKYVVKGPDGKDTQDKPHYTWVINETSVHFDSLEHLQSQIAFRRTVAEAVNRAPPPVTSAQHERFIESALLTVVEEHLPFEAGMYGEIMETLWDFLREFGTATCWEDVQHGKAWLRDEDGRRRAYFHWSFLHDHIDRRGRRGDVSRRDIWATLSKYARADNGRAHFSRALGGGVRWWRVDLPEDWCTGNGGPLTPEIAACERE